jgi:hypothetical protein
MAQQVAEFEQNQKRMLLQSCSANKFHLSTDRSYLYPHKAINVDIIPEIERIASIRHAYADYKNTKGRILPNFSR